MTLARLMNQSLTVQKIGGSTDVYGDQVTSATGSPVTVTGFLSQEASQEFLENRDTAVSDWFAFLPAGTDIGHLDYITYNSQRFQVNGEPWPVYNPRKKTVTHIECRLVVVSG